MNKKILLVEDDQFMRDIYTDVLKNDGFTVEAALDGKQAVEKLSQSDWDLVLLDVFLPDFTGFEVLNKLKEQQKEVKSPIIFLTNADKEEYQKKAMELGSGYIIKSQLNPDEFLAQIKKQFK
jgi:DNA-binding response OmpR family regulator